MPNYKTLAIVDDVNTCDCCGKTGLKSTVVMACEAGEIKHFGSVCATRHSGRDIKIIKDEVRQIESKKLNAAKSELMESTEYQSCQLKIAEAHRNGIKPGSSFHAFVKNALEAADRRQQEICVKYGIKQFVI